MADHGNHSGSTQGQQRPDRAGYVIDTMFDDVQMHNNETGAVEVVTVVQVWMDGENPALAEGSRLRAFMERMAAERLPTILRWPSGLAATIFPPALSSDGKWHAVEGERKAGVGRWG